MNLFMSTEQLSDKRLLVKIYNTGQDFINDNPKEVRIVASAKKYMSLIRKIIMQLKSES